MLRDSVVSIKSKAKIDKQINEQNAAKKEAGKGLGEIKDAIKKLQTEIDFVKKNQTEKQENKESFDKSLD